MISNYNYNKKLHDTLLMAIVDFDKICKENNLTYFLHGGTLLGAIRHSGFIPWDDDVDIVMLKKDHSEFLKIISKNKEFKKKYYIQNYITDPNMIDNSTKVRIKNTSFVKQGEKNEAFLDIFPMVDVPNTKLLRYIQKKVIIFLNQIVYAKVGYIKPNRRISKIVFGVLSKINRVLLGNVIEIIINYFPHYKSKYVNIVFTANYHQNTGYEKDLWPKRYYLKTEQKLFCNHSFSVTKYWRQYLTKMYGDYLKYPPENERINKHNIYLE